MNSSKECKDECLARYKVVKQLMAMPKFRRQEHIDQYQNQHGAAMTEKLKAEMIRQANPRRRNVQHHLDGLRQAVG